MSDLVVYDEGIPRTRYWRVGAFSSRSRAPRIDRTKKVVTVFFPLSPRLAYIVGAAYGDGSVSKRKVTYFNSNKAWLHSVSEELGRLNLSGRPRARLLPARRGSVPLIEYANSALARLIGGSQPKRLCTVETLTKGEALLAAFTAGFFDSEGSAAVHVNGSHPNGAPVVAIANTNL